MHGKYIRMKKYKCNKEKKETLRWKGKIKNNIRKWPSFCCKLRFGLPTPKMCFADYYDDVSGAAKRNCNEIREKIKTDYKYLPKKVMRKGIYLKLMFFVCLYVSTATKEGANRLNCAWLTLLKGMTRSRWNGHSSLSLKSELLETRSFFSV